MPVLSLGLAVQRALQNQPQIQQARAAVLAAQARVDQSFSGLLPQVTATATYQRTASDYPASRSVVADATGSSVTGSPGTTATSLTSGNNFRFGVTGSLLVYDFGQVRGRWHAAEATASSQEANEQATRAQVVLTARTAFFQVRAQKALLEVARETLANQDKHLAQIEGFVELGKRPGIDLAQARADHAGAEVQVINAQSSYDTARAQLSQAMGDDQPGAFDVSDDSLPEVDGEEGSVDRLVVTAIANRQDLAALKRQEEAQRSTVRAIKGAYGPSLNVSTGVNEAGRELGSMNWSWNAQATLSWSIYQGGLTKAQVSEAEANVSSSIAQQRGLRLQVRLDVQRAQLAARSAKAALRSAEIAVVNARERYRLAEGRYAAGVGNIIELGDAQVALATALGQKVQSDYALATARAQLLQALGHL